MITKLELNIPNSEYYVMGLEQQILYLVSWQADYKLKAKLRLCSKFLAEKVEFTEKDKSDYRLDCEAKERRIYVKGVRGTTGPTGGIGVTGVTGATGPRGLMGPR